MCLFYFFSEDGPPSSPETRSYLATRNWSRSRRWYLRPSLTSRHVPSSPCSSAHGAPCLIPVVRLGLCALNPVGFVPPAGAGECGRKPLAGVRLLPPAGCAIVGVLLRCPPSLGLAVFVACGPTIVPMCSCPLRNVWPHCGKPPGAAGSACCSRAAGLVCRRYALAGYPARYAALSFHERSPP
jgi:hypothetical protein